MEIQNIGSETGGTYKKLVKKRKTLKTKPKYISLLPLFNRPLKPIKNEYYHNESHILEKTIKHKLKHIHSLDSFKTFILIIDFPELGGGTAFFLNNIISKYKNNTTFLIARNIKGFVRFNMNETFILDKKFNDKESIAFLNDIQPKIIKIFVNHTLGHSTNFIQHLFTLNKEITTITHDFLFLIKDKYHIPYKDFNKKYQMSNININNFDTIITQNMINTKFIHPFFKNKIIVSELPDFKKSLHKITNTRNDSDPITIGFIGAISNIKGSSIIDNIVKFYKNNNRIKFILFGRGINIIPNVPYHSIEELNQLLIKFKPNVIVETSIGPETYSYTLTLAMLTQLPILYFEKPVDSVIKRRLTYYNAHSFNSMEQLNTLILKVNQNFLYTIEPVIYFNDFWDNYFHLSVAQLKHY
jgi:hypothetical protein